MAASHQNAIDTQQDHGRRALRTGLYSLRSPNPYGFRPMRVTIPHATTQPQLTAFAAQLLSRYLMFPRPLR